MMFAKNLVENKRHEKKPKSMHCFIIIEKGEVSFTTERDRCILVEDDLW